MLRNTVSEHAFTVPWFGSQQKKDSQRCAASPLLQTVRARGVEPPPSCEDRNLNPARLPIPPRPQSVIL